YIRFVSKNGKRHLVGSFQKFDEKKTLNFDIRLEQPHKEHFVLAMPWEQKHHFYYNQKINCMPAKGWVKYNGTKYTFEPETDFAMLNWGRGVWPYENEWVWGVGNGYVNEKPFGFQIEYGFGDTKSASGNMIFYDGKIHKLEDVTCKIAINSDGNFWKITSSDKRFEMNFRPFMDYAKDTNYKVLINQQHQIFGYMNGIAVLDDGTRLEVKDFLCFIEKGKNKY
ncbi:MAG: DUF2804 domain-containing protein, partial [Lachnospiraceae bacterium]|nr:DUF2804 domain-containing protein [Lachnospiraceae bacterium]